MNRIAPELSYFVHASLLDSVDTLTVCRLPRRSHHSSLVVEGASVEHRYNPPQRGNFDRNFEAAWILCCRAKGGNARSRGNSLIFWAAELLLFRMGRKNILSDSISLIGNKDGAR